MIPPSKAERVPEEGFKEVCDGPLDLSDRGKSKSSQSPRDYSPLALQGVDKVQNSPDKDFKSNPLPSPHQISPLTSSSTNKHKEEPAADHKYKVMLGLKATKLKDEKVRLKMG